MKNKIYVDEKVFWFCKENPIASRNFLKKSLALNPYEKRLQNLNPDLKINPYHGWLKKYLFPAETMVWGRWAYWMEIVLNGALPDREIPQIWFERDEETFKHIEDSLNIIPTHGKWIGRESYKIMNYFLDWLLFGFGCSLQTTLPKEPSGCEGAAVRLYQFFNLDQLICYPYDYLGDLFVDIRIGDNLGFFPTPHDVCELLSRILECPDDRPGMKGKDVYDPCVGTGRTLLHQSNYCLTSYAQELNLICIKAAKVNFYMYAPWFAAPLPKQYLTTAADAATNQCTKDVFGNLVKKHLEDECIEDNYQCTKDIFGNLVKKHLESNLLFPIEEVHSLAFSVAENILERK